MPIKSNIHLIIHVLCLLTFMVKFRYHYHLLPKRTYSKTISTKTCKMVIIHLSSNSTMTILCYEIQVPK